MSNIITPPGGVIAPLKFVGHIQIFVLEDGNVAFKWENLGPKNVEIILTNVLRSLLMEELQDKNPATDVSPDKEPEPEKKEIPNA